MTIAELREKCKGVKEKIPRDYAVVLVLILAASASFGLGYRAGKIAGQGSPLPTNGTFSGSETPFEEVVASHGGTKYYLPWCGGAERISETNRVWFKNPAAAEAAGYEPASNCDGL